MGIKEKENTWKDFRELEAWKRCRDLRKRFWKLVKQFPAEERYNLSDQIIRASRSTTACIAEGYGRYHYQENIQFCRQARGSLYELIDHVGVAEECGYLDNNSSAELIDQIQTAIRILNGYIKYLKNRKESEK